MDVELVEVRDFLAQHPPFDALPAEVLDDLPRRFTVTYARRGTEILPQGQRGDRLWLVRSGAVDITDEGQLVDRVGAGGAFGMSAVVEHGPTRYAVTAREDTLLLTLPQADFDELAGRHPAVAVHFAASTPNFLILEYRPDQSGPARDLVREPLALEDGHIRIPDRPGLGVELNEAAFAGKPLKGWRRPLVIEADGNIGYQ